jgi:hypothetical protein
VSPASLSARIACRILESAIVPVNLGYLPRLTDIPPEVRLRSASKARIATRCVWMWSGVSIAAGLCRRSPRLAAGPHESFGQGRPPLRRPGLARSSPAVRSSAPHHPRIAVAARPAEEAVVATPRRPRAASSRCGIRPVGHPCRPQDVGAHRPGPRPLTKRAGDQRDLGTAAAYFAIVAPLLIDRRRMRVDEEQPAVRVGHLPDTTGPHRGSGCHGPRVQSWLRDPQAVAEAEIGQLSDGLSGLTCLKDVGNESG